MSLRPLRRLWSGLISLLSRRRRPKIKLRYSSHHSWEWWKLNSYCKNHSSTNNQEKRMIRSTKQLLAYLVIPLSLQQQGKVLKLRTKYQSHRRVQLQATFRVNINDVRQAPQAVWYMLHRSDKGVINTKLEVGHLDKANLHQAWTQHWIQVWENPQEAEARQDAWTRTMINNCSLRKVTKIKLYSILPW